MNDDIMYFTPSQGGFFAKPSVPNGKSLEADLSQNNIYIHVLIVRVRRMPIRFLSISFGFDAIEHESIFTSPAIDNFLD